MEHAHNSIENILNHQDFNIEEKFDFLADNIIKVMLSNPKEPYVYAFIERKYLYVLFQKIAKKLEEMEDFSLKNESFQYDYGNPKFSFEENSKINNESREVFINKMAMFSSIYSDSEL